MRPPRILLAVSAISLALLACGDAGNDSSAGFASAPTEAGDSTGAATGGGPVTTPTTTDPMVTASASASASESASASASASESATDATETSATDSGEGSSTGELSGDGSSGTGGSTGGSTGAVSASEGSSSSSGAEESSTGPGCPEGQDGCPCGPNDACDPGLACVQGVCGPPAPKCGDGKVDPGEGCDDGNGVNGDGCEANCTKTPAPKCGDGKVDPGEGCDDGNGVNGDGCETNCTKTPMQAKDACGFASDDGVWFEIDYENAFTVSSPGYKYSPTPGWGEAQWAPAGKSWPYAVDLFNNAKVIEDQIGTVALLDGTNKAVRVYFGLVGLNYTHATVCVEGRSYSVGSSVTFFVQEASTKVGEYGMLSNSWEVHKSGIDMQHFFIAGKNFQAVQIQPSSGSGSLSLKRLRVTLHGATY